MNGRTLILIMIVVGSSLSWPARAGDLKAGAAAASLVADDSLVIGGGIGPGKAHGQEGELRAVGPRGREPARESAIALIACDVLMIERDVLDRAARRVEQETGIPFDHILINATHTHHAPTTVTVHGYQREEAFTRQVEDKIVEAAVAAVQAAGAGELPVPAGRGVVGRARTAGCCWGTGRSTGWARTPTPCGRPARSIPSCRCWRSGGPTGRTRRSSSTTRRTRSARTSRASGSPSFYGLAAQALEKEKGGTVLFFEGASGSTHNLDRARPIEATLPDQAGGRRWAGEGRGSGRSTGSQAARKEISAAGPPVRRGQGRRARWLAYCTKRIPDPEGRPVGDRDLPGHAEGPGPEAGRGPQDLGAGDRSWATSRSWECPASSSRCSARRSSGGRRTATRTSSSSPTTMSATSRTTAGFDRGGYQVWMGLHSFLERGSGEIIVDEAVRLLEQLHGEESGGRRAR